MFVTFRPVIEVEFPIVWKFIGLIRDSYGSSPDFLSICSKASSVVPYRTLIRFLIWLSALDVDEGWGTTHWDPFSELVILETCSLFVYCLKFVTWLCVLQFPRDPNPNPFFKDPRGVLIKPPIQSERGDTFLSRYVFVNLSQWRPRTSPVTVN